MKIRYIFRKKNLFNRYSLLGYVWITKTNRAE